MVAVVGAGVPRFQTAADSTVGPSGGQNMTLEQLRERPSGRENGL